MGRVSPPHAASPAVLFSFSRLLPKLTRLFPEPLYAYLRNICWDLQWFILSVVVHAVAVAPAPSPPTLQPSLSFSFFFSCVLPQGSRRTLGTPFSSSDTPRLVGALGQHKAKPHAGNTPCLMSHAIDCPNSLTRAALFVFCVCSDECFQFTIALPRKHSCPAPLHCRADREERPCLCPASLSRCQDRIHRGRC